MLPWSAICLACLSISCLPFQMSCSRYMLIRELSLFLQQIIVSFTLTLRVYALYGRSKRLLSCMIIIALALIGGASAGSFGGHSNTTPYIQGSDCHNTFSAKTAARHGLAWVAVSVYDLLIFVLTVFRTYKTRGFPRLTSYSRDILDIIFHGGAMYFAAMTLINLPNILTYYCGSDITRANLATFTSCMSVTLISRLVLNLHKSTDDGILSTAIRANGRTLDVFTTLDMQSALSSHDF
ncbi:uncharacterized protein EDB93DRAFT_298883 [Suillus bovinus]|uniref:uncharacterized protein n=1 Tax=Suillus bovinus TaxID=48563 RepID=UPI001B8806E9|nr:uncharacterized protein EDB93DRAFT_298883 [Suillus bovinus]KAG2151165.1 hypothetical protein EDB93DRAFT_298883 [Suillus bovinus]